MGTHVHTCVPSYLEGKETGEEVVTDDVWKRLRAIVYIFPLLCITSMKLTFLQFSCFPSALIDSLSVKHWVTDIGSYLKRSNWQAKGRPSHEKGYVAKEVCLILSSADLNLTVLWTRINRTTANTKWPSVASRFILISGINKRLENISKSWAELLSFTLKWDNQWVRHTHARKTRREPSLRGMKMNATYWKHVVSCSEARFHVIFVATL